jgi:2-methylcitrate dehydratase PrpD
MKNVFKVLGVIALAAAIGFLIAACEVDRDRESTDTALNGTWVKGSKVWEFKNGNFEESIGGSPAAKGFYTTKSDKMTIIITGIHGGSPEFAVYQLASKWYSKDEFKADTGATDGQLNEIFQTIIEPYSVNDTTLIWGEDTYTAGSGPGE